MQQIKDTYVLRLGETARIGSKPCIIKRYALLDLSDHLLLYRVEDT